MNKYQILGTVAVSCWTVVEAESLEAAIEIAKSRSLAEVNIDGFYEESEFWHIDTDGTPDDLRSDDD